MTFPRERRESLLVSYNPELRSLAGFTRSSDAQGIDDGGIGIRENPKLESLDGLDSLRDVTYLEISSNDSLSSLSLNHIEHIGQPRLGTCGDTGKDGFPDNASGSNPALTALDGFDSLISLTTLSVSGQSGLTSLDRLRELAEAGVEFTQTDFQVNENLDIAEIEAFVAAAGSSGSVCQNAGDETICMCPSSE